MTPEERNLERFVREKQRADKKGALFNLEDDELTHFGQPLMSDEAIEDFNEDDIELSDASENGQKINGHPSKRRKLSDASENGQKVNGHPSKRRKLSDEAGSGDDDLAIDGTAQPERPRTKNEVMKEVVAKSKLYKYERQQAKEDDDDLQAEIDKSLPDIYALLPRTTKMPAAPQIPELPNGVMNPDRLALLNGKDRAQADKEYDERLKEYTFDQRSRPTVRTLTEEEKLEQEAKKLKDLEDQRLRRMRGDPDSEEEDSAAVEDIPADGDPDLPDTDGFGLGSGIPEQQKRQELEVEDEDEFVIEDDLIASGSDVEIPDVEDSASQSDHEVSDEEDREFLQGLLSTEDSVEPRAGARETTTGTTSSDLPFTFPCPQTQNEFIDITRNIAVSSLPTVVQRIRALYQPKLSPDNKVKLAVFSAVLIDHISYLANQPSHPPFNVLEALIRHTHSLAMREKRPLAPTSGDLILLTAISTSFPTSDHFHQVVTQAMLCMTRYLGQKVPQTLSDLVTGTYIACLALQYQRSSRRYIPELVNYLFTAVYAIMPPTSKAPKGPCPTHSMPASLQMASRRKQNSTPEGQLNFWDTIPSTDVPDENNHPLKASLLKAHLSFATQVTQIWRSSSAFLEIIEPVIELLEHIESRGKSLELFNVLKVKQCSIPCPTLLTKPRVLTSKLSQLLA